MTIIRYIGTVLTVILLMMSCDLDTSPSLQLDGGNLTDDDVETLIVGTLAYLKEDNGVMRASHYVGEFGGDNVSLSGTTSDPLMFIYDYKRITTSTRIGYLWEFSYKAIININATLDRLKEGQSFEKDVLIGENLYLRAFHYFLLVNTFGQPYVNNPSTNMGVPIKLTTSMDDFPGRHTVAEVYDQIVKDLEKAVELMTMKEGKIPKDNAYASKETAQALLSRVYLYMEDWAKAEEYATAVINSGRYKLVTGTKYQTYATFNPKDNEETIFAVRFHKDDKKYEPSYMVGSMYTTIDNKGWGEMFPSHPYLMLLDRFPNDLRHGFIDKQLGEAGFQFIYNNDNHYAMVTITKEGDSYVITDPTDFGSAEVKTEPYLGGIVYYILNKSNDKIYGRVEKKCEPRNGYPTYYMNKLALQEGQATLYSPIVSRLAEMYLNRAEARYHMNDITGALEDVNVIRARAEVPKWTTSANPAPDEITIPNTYPILDVILDERRVELAFEGHRRHDVYRNRKNLDRKYPGGHVTSNGPLTLIYASKEIVEFIPENEIKAYPNPDLIIQNP